MRKDLNKLLTERERNRSGLKHAYVRNTKSANVSGKKRLGVEAWPLHGESGSPYPYKEGIKKPYQGNTKSFSENLNPLWGFIRKSVGKNWDQVYSELCQNFDKRSVINQHILVHLFQNIEINTRMNGSSVEFLDTGKIWDKNKGWQLIKDSNADYYIHPVSKLLLANTAKRTYRQINAESKQKHEEDIKKNLVLLSRFANQNGNGARYAIKINDIWYEISVIKKPEPVKRRRVRADGETEYYTHYPEINSISIHGAKHVPEELRERDKYGTWRAETHYVSRKNQLSSTNLKKLKLTNG